MVGPMDAYRYLLPATHWVAHMASGTGGRYSDSTP